MSKEKDLININNNILFHCKNINSVNTSIKHLLVCEDEFIDAGIKSFEKITKDEFVKDFKLCAEFSSSNWHSMKNELSTFLSENFKGKEKFSAEVKLLAEELLLNAFFNAPIDENKNKLYANKKRSENIILKDKKTELGILSYNKSVIVKVRDYYGTLHASQILAKIVAGINRNVSELTPNIYGAGIGLGLAYTYSDILVFKITQEVCTDISLIKFRKSVGYKLICIFNSEKGEI